MYDLKAHWHSYIIAININIIYPFLSSIFTLPVAKAAFIYFFDFIWHVNVFVSSLLNFKINSLWQLCPIVCLL